jgi:hypothetical protein
MQKIEVIQFTGRCPIIGVWGYPPHPFGKELTREQPGDCLAVD